MTGGVAAGLVFVAAEGVAVGVVGVPPPIDGSERAMAEGLAVFVAGATAGFVAAAFLGIMKYDVIAECYEVYII
jgi:hypothetical protein